VYRISRFCGSQVVTTPIIIYLGPSMLDGAPIVCLATVHSANRKTGRLVQTWIVRADVSPVDAYMAGADSAVCGQCPRRHSLGGDCYVRVVTAPHAAWRLWDRSGRPGENWSDESQICRLQGDALQYGLRLGSYGDPAAVPHAVWADLIDALQPRTVVGYTHQWRSLESHLATTLAISCDSWERGDESERVAWYRDHVMASCDSVEDARDARALGWRCFLAIPATDRAAVPERTVQCPATISDRTCATCGACDGAARGATKASIYLLEHGARSGAKARRASGLTVINGGQ